MHLRAARELLEAASQRALTEEQRRSQTVELASYMLLEASAIQTPAEKAQQGELARMMRDPRGKAFTMCMTDQCFRSQKPARIASQLVYLLDLFGIPSYLSPMKRLALISFHLLGEALSWLLVPVATLVLRKATNRVILPGEKEALKAHMSKRREEGIRLNINHLGEAILGEAEARSRLDLYLKDLASEEIEYISIKISTIFSQINILSWEETLHTLAERLKTLYRAAMRHQFKRADGREVPKFVNLDMEEYRDLLLTKELFKRVLGEEEFFHCSAGIVLQAYLPDSHEIQRELTDWALQRVKKGGAPIKIRIVKGANLAMEQLEASLRDWPQAPYRVKAEVDANYKRMLSYGCIPEHAKAVHLGIASHNLFDIAYALLLRAEHHVEKTVSFEMLEGMADHLRRVVQKLSKEILLYCPVATRGDFQNAIAYLIRRLDENTGQDNFLRHIFGLTPGTTIWEEQAQLFLRACEQMQTAPVGPRRTQDRHLPPIPLQIDAPFENEADTDFCLPQNRRWAEEILKKQAHTTIAPIPLVIGGKEIHEKTPQGLGIDPSHPKKTLYTYSMASWPQVDAALNSLKGYETVWGNTSVDERCAHLARAAHKLRERRAELLGAMLADGGKILTEGDAEVSEAIDFAEYYLRSMKKMDACKDIAWTPKGTALITPPWNFPVSIAAGGIFAALVTGNCVLFKPAPESVLSGWVLAKALWEAGIPKEALQFLNCPDDPVGSRLIADPRVNCVLLTGATSTARLFLKLRPTLDLAAETGGKNAIIVTGLSDRDLAIKDIVQSAFGHAGQKCSACSLAILEAEVYDDPRFKRQLKDAVESLKVGSAWNLSSKVPPLIREPTEALLRALTSLDEEEEWLVKPKQDPHISTLWSCGVKWGVRAGSFMHTTELFGPVLAVMRAKNLEHAIQLANATAYGLTSGLHSLDAREQQVWMEKIESGNCYINRGITGAIVRRQPFGGTKASSFGRGFKAGGPNYISQFCIPTQINLPQEKQAIAESVNHLNHFLQKLLLTQEELGLWYASIANYSFWAQRFSHDHDPSHLIGQDNLLRYVPQKKVVLRIQESDSALDILRTLAAALSCECLLEVSWSRGKSAIDLYDHLRHELDTFHIIEESEEALCQRMQTGTLRRVRVLSSPSKALYEAAAPLGCHIAHGPVLASGRFELLHYLREVSFSIDYHRYGNLGVREAEIRKPIF